jgi:hypothetical protein
MLSSVKSLSISLQLFDSLVQFLHVRFDNLHIADFHLWNVLVLIMHSDSSLLRRSGAMPSRARHSSHPGKCTHWVAKVLLRAWDSGRKKIYLKAGVPTIVLTRLTHSRVTAGDHKNDSL